MDGYVDTFAGQAKESEKLATYKAMSKIGKNGLIQGLLKQQWGFLFEDRVKKAGEQALDSLEKFSANRLAQIEKEMKIKEEEEQKKKLESVEQKDNKDISKNNEDISVEEKGKNSQEITNDNSIKENKKENDNQQINNTNSKQEQIEKNTDTVANKIETKQPIQQENSIPAKQDIVEPNNIENIDSAKNNIDTELLNKDNKDQIEHDLNDTTIDTSLNASSNNDDTISEIDNENNKEQNKETTVNSTAVVANLSSAIKAPNNNMVQKSYKGNNIINSLNKEEISKYMVEKPKNLNQQNIPKIPQSSYELE